MIGRTKTVTYGEGGWRAEVVEDDDNGSGLGDHTKVGFWYGTREECEKIDPAKVNLYKPVYNDTDPFDLACERRFD